jgi:hypothetical protein
MIPTIRLVCLAFTALVAWATLSLDSRRAARLLRPAQAATVVGGQAVDNCAKSVAKSTDSCYLRPVEVGGETYRCDGKDLDQVCIAATTQTNNICGESKATCSGNQFKYDDGKWVPQNKPCEYSQYETRYLQSGKCTPAVE